MGVGLFCACVRFANWQIIDEHVSSLMLHYICSCD